jgi:ATP-dependent RNA helicase DDX42
VKTVVNYDIAKNLDAHTHRIGRTGRAGEKGIAWTLILRKETPFAADLVRSLESSNSPIPPPLYDMAMANPWFRKTRQGKTTKFTSTTAAGPKGAGRGRMTGGIGFQSQAVPPPRTPGIGSGVPTGKEALMASFRTSFVPATENTLKASYTPPPPPPPPPKVAPKATEDAYNPDEPTVEDSPRRDDHRDRERGRESSDRRDRDRRDRDYYERRDRDRDRDYHRK